jgi:crotonobetaine/carnitine-CoA ligase
MEDGTPNYSTGDRGFLGPFFDIASSDPDRTYARFRDQSYSFEQLQSRSAQLAGWLQLRGISAGDHVAVMAANSAPVLTLLFAIGRLGAVWVPLNTRAVGANLAYILDHSSPELIVCDAELKDTICGSGAGIDPDRIVTADALAGVPETQTDWPAPDLPDPDLPFAIMYTSGTTGPPKGVLVSHRMLWLAGQAAALTASAQDGDVMHMWEPLFHIGGAQMMVMPMIRQVILNFTDGFSARRFWSEVREAGGSHVHYLGGILQILLKQPPSDLDRSHGARIAWGGGCPAEIWRSVEERFGVEVRECYGMTECSSFSTCNLNGTFGSVGQPLPWFEVSVERDGAAVRAGEKGEIIVTSKLDGALTAGYLNNPDATAKALRGNRFHPGDLGSLDQDGNLFFHGRMSDSVRVRGENVSAFEVEHVAARHPAVEDCAMAGVAAEIGEQEIILFAKLKDGEACTEGELWSWLSERLAVYQTPRYIRFVEEFDRTPSLRIMKHRLPLKTEDAWDRLKAQA